MAVREFNYQEALNTMNNIKTNAQTIKSVLSNCNDIINENVGVSGKWSGDRANVFKAKWQKTSAEFDSFYRIIMKDAEKVQASYDAHKRFENQ